MSHKLLLIDDDAVIQQLFQILLKPAGLDVYTAESIAHARGRLDTDRPDLILLDLNLGGADGLAFARDLNTLRIPVLVVSASSDPETRERARAAGAAGFIAKPINPRTFAQEIKEYLGHDNWLKETQPDPREEKLRLLRKQFLDTALASIAALAQRSDEELFSDTLLADSAHKWVGASSVEGMPDVESEAREVETLARARRIDQAGFIRERLRSLEEKFKASQN